jgi:hypothetical protein
MLREGGVDEAWLFYVESRSRGEDAVVGETLGRRCPEPRRPRARRGANAGHWRPRLQEMASDQGRPGWTMCEPPSTPSGASGSRGMKRRRS